jgi:hypothetical protein
MDTPKAVSLEAAGGALRHDQCRAAHPGVVRITGLKATGAKDEPTVELAPANAVFPL